MTACFPFKHVFMQYGNSVTWSICPKFQQLLFFHAVRSMSELCLVSKLSSVFLRREHVFQTSLLLPFSKLVCKPVAKLFSSTCSDNRTKMLCTTQRAIKPRKGKGTLMQVPELVAAHDIYIYVCRVSNKFTYIGRINVFIRKKHFYLYNVIK